MMENGMVGFNPYSIGSYFGSEKTEDINQLWTMSFNPYSIGSYFGRIMLKSLFLSNPLVSILILLEVTLEDSVTNTL